MEYCNLNDSWGLLDGGLSVSAVQHHNGKNMGLFVHYGDRYGSPVNAVPPALPVPADMVVLQPQDTFVFKLQVLDLDCELRLKTKSVVSKSQGQYKAFCCPKQSWPN